uniref:Uncharacterized protein n=1 Tax=Romanomermis culicivorax TaxID=13658 RepID=A0A915K843_ROMCU
MKKTDKKEETRLRKKQGKEIMGKGCPATSLGQQTAGIRSSCWRKEDPVYIFLMMVQMMVACIFILDEDRQMDHQCKKRKNHWTFIGDSFRFHTKVDDNRRLRSNLSLTIDPSPCFYSNSKVKNLRILIPEIWRP